MRISASLSTSQLAIFLRSLRLFGRGGLVGFRHGLMGRFGGLRNGGAARSLLKANLRTSAIFCAPLPLRTRDRSSWKVTSSVQCQSILDAPVAADAAREFGCGAGAGRDVVAGVEAGAILHLGPRFDFDDGARVDEADLAGKAPVAVEPIDLPQD